MMAIIRVSVLVMTGGGHCWHSVSCCPLAAFIKSTQINHISSHFRNAKSIGHLPRLSMTKGEAEAEKKWEKVGESGLKLREAGRACLVQG